MRRDGVRRARPDGGGRGALRLHHAEGPQPDEEGRPQVPEADVRSVDFFEGRGLDRVAVAELATCGFVGRGENVVLQGLTGTGKTYLACALAKAACARRVRSCYVRQPDLEDLWRESRDRPGGERKLVRKYGGVRPARDRRVAARQAGHRVQVDAAGADGAEVRHGLDRILHPVQEEGTGTRGSAAGCMPTPSWTGCVHNAVWVDMGEANMRQRRG
ncbi:MAG: ATP-binding protein [Collinsella sp.]